MKFKETLNKIPKLALASFIAFTTIFTNGIPVTKAASYNLTEKFQSDWNFFGSSKWGNGSILYLDGKEAFCIEPDKVSAIGPNEPIKPSDIGLTNSQLDTMALITWYGYRSKSKPTKVDYMMTQNLVWKYLGSGQRMGNSTYPNESSMQSWFNDVMNKVTHFHDKPSFDGQTVSVDAGDTANINDANKILSGLRIKSVTGGKASISGNTLKVTPDGTLDTMTVSFDRGMSSEQTRDTIVVRHGQSQAVSYLTGKDPYGSIVRIKVNRTGSLKITKQDEDGNYVSNTSFKLSKNADMSSPIGTYTTGSDGTVTVNDLEQGTWYIQETSVPSHLVLDTTIRTVTINPNETATYTAKNNWVKGKIKLRKVDSKTNEQVGGATYAIYNQQGQELERLVTTATGYVESGYLRFGEYRVKEIIAPEGYVLNPQEYSVTVSENEQRIEVSGSDKPIEGYIQVLKRDAETGKTVVKANTTFSVYKSDNTYVTDITTNNNGIAKSDLLRYGSYYLVEKTAPDGYTHSDEKLVYTITEDGKTYEAVLSNTRVKGRLEISKEDSVTGKEPQGEATLKGAVYGLYARNAIVDPADGTEIYPKGKLIARLTTDDKAEASIDELYLGDYLLKEIEPSHGYTLDTTEYDFSLTYENQNVEIVTKKQTVKERVIAQAFSLIKVSSDNSGEADLLEGVEFTVKAQKDIDKYGSWEKAPIAKNAKGETAKVLVTDKKGYAVSDELPYGKYIVRETKTPDDKWTVPDFEVIVNEDSREPQVWRVFNDQAFKAVLKIVKKDAETGKTVLLPNATFKIKNTDTGEYVKQWVWFPLPHLKDTWKTDEFGMVYTNDVLKAGNYALEEITAPNGYVLNKEPVPFKVTNKGAYEVLPDGETPVVEVELSDVSVKGKITVSKIGEQPVDTVIDKDGNIQFIYEKKPVDGAKFIIKAAEDILSADNQGDVIYKKGTTVAEFTTKDGKATTDKLPLGKYKVYEVIAGEGFVLNKEVKEVELKYKDQETEVVIESTEYENQRQKVELNLRKVDSETNTGIKGAVFGIYAKKDVIGYNGKLLVKKDTLIETAVSDENGRLNFKVDLPVNSLFEIREIKAPIGYASTDEIVSVDTKYKGQDIAVIKVEKDIANEIIKVEVSKKDATTEKELPGAHLTLKEKDGPVFETWISGNEPHIVKGLEPGKTYELIETSSPYGFALAQKVEFKVEDSGKVQKVEMKDNLVVGYLKWQKTGEAFNRTITGQTEFGMTQSPVWDEQNLLGAKVTIYAAEDITLGNGVTYWQKDEAIETLESDWEPVQSTKLLVGRYYYVESSGLHGYVTDTQKHYFEIKDSQSTKIQIVDSTLENKRPKVQVEFTKKMEQMKDHTVSEPWKDVIFGVYAREDIYSYMGEVAIENGQLIATTGINEDGQLTNFPDLPNGVYFIKELQTHDMYKLDPKEYDFEIGWHGGDVSEYKITIGNEEGIVNELQRGKIYLHKTDMETREAMKGVRFTIATDKNFKHVVQSQVTDHRGYAEFKDLELGLYFLREDPVDGYVTNEHIYEVEIKKDGDELGINVENKPLEMEFSKQDLTTGKELEGAKMAVTEKESGKVIDEWTSGKEPHKNKYLVQNREYVLTEKSAPRGYEVAESITFKAQDGLKIVMKDKRIPEKPKTGVDANPLIWCSFVLVAGIAAVGLYLKSKRNQ